jgi:2-isopropylmalate synthase
MIIDDTLREGMQSPNMAFTVEEKLRIFNLLTKAGVRRFIAGYPPAHSSEAEAISKMVASKRAQVYGLGRALKKDIEIINETGANIALHFPFGDYNINEIADAVRFASKTGKEVEVAVVDISSYEIGKLVNVVRLMFDSGATAVQLPDTTGKASPTRYHDYVKAVKEKVNGEIIVHCHNDLGCAILNSYLGTLAGADLVACTIFGLGERNGIADLSSMVSVLSVDGKNTSVNLDALREAYESLAEMIKKKIGMSPMHEAMPVYGKYIQTVVAGTHAVSEKFPQKDIFLNAYCGRNLLREALKKSVNSIDDHILNETLREIKNKSSSEGVCLNPREGYEIYAKLLHDAAQQKKYS